MPGFAIACGVCLMLLAGAGELSAAEREGGLRAWSFVEPLGVATFSVLVLTALSGFFMRKKPRVLRRIHIYLAIGVLALASCHAVLIFVLGD